MEFITGLMSLDTALNEMLSRVTPLTAQETLPLVQCFGRILASDVVSPLDVPGFDNSAMDGYAVRLADIASGQPLPVAGKSFAGQPYHGEWPGGYLHSYYDRCAGAGRLRSGGDAGAD